MRTTTEETLADDITEVIRGLTPNADMRQGDRWTVLDELEHVAGASLRGFYVDIPSESIAPDAGQAYFSPAAVSFDCTVLVYTSYANLRRREQRALTPRDGRQVWLALEVQRDADTDPTTIAGLFSCEYQGWQVEDDDQGRYWGAHVYAVRYLVSGLPGAT